MHSKQVCHRDLKPENIIYQAETGLVKIIDFGFAISSKEPLKVFCGTPTYMSPEIVSKIDYNGAAADLWACGVIMYTLVTGAVPFKCSNERGLFAKI
jgi:serine/threonine protein kinase